MRFRFRRRLGLPLGVALLLVPSAACAASRSVAPGGTDSGDCVSSPCGSFSYAYGQAVDGDVIEVAAGTYGPQSVPYGTKRVTFLGRPGAAVRKLDNHASNITFDGVDVDAGFTQPNGAAFENHGGAGGRRVTFRNARIGNVVDQKGALLGGSDTTEPTGVVIDNVVFHDVVARSEGVHIECLMAHAPGLTLRNSTFRNCSTMAVSLGRGDWWGQPPYGDVVLENNVFEHSTNGDGWHHYGLAWFVGKFKSARVVNNTFENAVLMEDEHVGPGPHSGVWANNLGGGWSCVEGVTYAGNIGTKCSESDRAMSPSSSCAPPACSPARTMPAGWADPERGDFRLRPGSVAIDAGSADHAPRTDRDGRARDERPDVGAYEFRRSEPRSHAPAADGSPGDTFRIHRATLRPRVICRKPRRGCPGRSRLQLRLAEPSRVVVRVRRLRGRRPARAVRTLRLAADPAVRRRIRARSLRRGRYRLVVRAAHPAGGPSRRARLRLRVR